MQKGSVLAAIAIGACLGACSRSQDPDSRIRSNPPPSRNVIALFQKDEVLSREWTNMSGTTLSLIEFSIVAVSNREPIAVAKYGNKATGSIYCVDIYQCSDTIDFARPALDLLCHDNNPAYAISSFRVEYQEGEVYLTFCRDAIRSAGSTISRNMYSYRYGKNSGITRAPGDFHWRTPRTERQSNAIDQSYN